MNKRYKTKEEIINSLISKFITNIPSDEEIQKQEMNYCSKFKVQPRIETNRTKQYWDKFPGWRNE